jgi:hypothetical protein
MERMMTVLVPPWKFHLYKKRAVDLCQPEL